MPTVIDNTVRRRMPTVIDMTMRGGADSEDGDAADDLYASDADAEVKKRTTELQKLDN